MSENERPDARQFWARGLVAPTAFPNYQLQYQANYWEDVAGKSAQWSHASEYSNDPLLAKLWTRLLELAPAHLAQGLAGTFVVKRQDWESQAATWASPHHFSGAVIDFNVGFSDATLQFATFFKRIERDGAALDQVADDARRMAYVTEMWRETGEVFVGEYGYTSEDITATSVGLSCLGDAWCLAHEAAHRLLGHVTGIPSLAIDDFSALMGDLAGAFNEPGGKELQADAFATFLLRGHDPFDSESQAAFEACFGSHLALAVLKLGDTDPERGDEDHPPIHRRLAFNAEVQRRLTGGDYAESVRADLEWSIRLGEATIAAATARQEEEEATSDGAEH